MFSFPLAFERQGENDVARGHGNPIGISGGKARIHSARRALTLDFAGGHAVKATPGAELPGKVNYIRGNDPKKWQLDLATYERVTYPEVYPGNRRCLLRQPAEAGVRCWW